MNVVATAPAVKSDDQQDQKEHSKRHRHAYESGDSVITANAPVSSTTTTALSTPDVSSKKSKHGQTVDDSSKASITSKVQVASDKQTATSKQSAPVVELRPPIVVGKSPSSGNGNSATSQNNVAAQKQTAAQAATVAKLLKDQNKSIAVTPKPDTQERNTRIFDKRTKQRQGAGGV